MTYTLGEAAKATGMSKAALSRAIKRGTFSAEKLDNGSFKIDPAELHRVYPATSESNPKRVTDQHELEAQNIELRAKLEAATQRLTDKDSVIDDLRRRLDVEGEERRKLTAILTDQRAKAPEMVVTSPPTSPAIITPPPAADPAPAAATAEPPPPARPNGAPAVVKVRPARKPPAKEVSWFRRMMGGR